MRNRSLTVPVLVLALSSGCVGKLGPIQQQSDSFEVDEAIHTIVLDGSSGDTFVQGGADVVSVSRYAEWRGDTPDVDAYVQDGVLYLSDGCDSWGWCSVEHMIDVPAGVSLKLRVGSGDMDVYAIDGDVTLDTGSGDVRAQRVTGDLVIDVGSGDISGDDLSGDSFFGQTGSGDVVMRFSEPPSLVDLETGSGDVLLEVPQADYNLDLDTGSGDIDLDGVQDASGADRHLRVSTGSGDIDIIAR